MSDQPAQPTSFALALAKMNADAETMGVIVVDHGSRRDESNQLLVRVAEQFQAETACRIVEPAHMELAEPSIRTAFDRAAAQGARLVVVHPYFLAPGRHWHRDIPDLAAEAASRHPEVRYLVTAPLGLHELIPRIIQDRIQQCLMRNLIDSASCDVCQESPACQIRTADP